MKTEELEKVDILENSTIVHWLCCDSSNLTLCGYSDGYPTEVDVMPNCSVCCDLIGTTYCPKWGVCTTYCPKWGVC